MGKSFQTEKWKKFDKKNKGTGHKLRGKSNKELSHLEDNYVEEDWKHNHSIDEFGENRANY